MALRRALPLLAALALAGCASGPPEPKPWAEVAARELHLSLASFEVQGRRVSLTRNAAATGPLPVVIYLPGIGQPSDAGQRWAATWAQAGYAVLGLQPLEDDAMAWRSALARTGEFRALGELHYGDPMRTERVAALRRLVTALQGKPPAGVALDWQRVAVAGYEIGAQAALDLGHDAAAWRPQAVIAISPPPMEAPAATPPALLVTSENDGDALGLVMRPSERLRAFDTLAPGAGWLLNLRSSSHAALAGTLAPEGWHAQDQHVEMTRAIRAGGGGGRRGEGGGNASPPSMYVGPRSGSASEAANANLADALRDTTAFLDAQLRGRPLNAPQLKPR